MDIMLTVDRALRNYQVAAAAADTAFSTGRTGAAYRAKQAEADQAHRHYVTLLKSAA